MLHTGALNIKLVSACVNLRSTQEDNLNKFCKIISLFKEIVCLLLKNPLLEKI